jgi:short-subunit dehydrogenase
MPRLAGKVALITGSSMGIGEAIARLFAAEGARLAIAARSYDKLRALAAALPVDALPIRADMTRPSDVRDMVARAAAHFGRIDILVNNAAVGIYAPIASMKPQHLEQLVATNWTGPLHAIQAVIPIMRNQGGGQIINISSVAGKVALPWMGAYCASKFALNALSDSLRMELRGDNIHVITVCPGRVKTAFPQNALRDFSTQPLFPGGISPQRVARAVLRASLRRKREVVVPLHNRLFPWSHAVFPSWIDRITFWILRPQMRKV